jgi:uncharacterized protein (DUF4415 family)
MTTKKKTKKPYPATKVAPKLVSERDDEDAVPSLDESFWEKAQIGSPLKKRLISLRLDADVIDWFKAQGTSYQTRMNQVLRTYMEFSKQSQK